MIHESVAAWRFNMNFQLGVLFFIAALGFTNGVTRKFPDNFMFGAATASYQIEGAWNTSDKGENIWDHLCHSTNLVANGDTGDMACDSYNNYKRDVEMLVELGVDFYRFSISWSRILPTGFANKVNPDGIRYYNALIDELLANNITPMITLYHWDLPQSIQNLGGWVNTLTANYFAEYADVAYSAFGDRVKYWITINEPQVSCFQGYGIMTMAPAINMTGIGEYLCAHTMILAHAKAFRLYDAHYRAEQKGKVGLTFNSNWLEPSDTKPETVQVAADAMEFELGWFANPIYSKDGDYPKVMKDKIAKKSEEQGYPFSRLPKFSPDEIKYIKGSFDFFGINHYTSSLLRKVTENDHFTVPSYEDDRDAVHFANSTWPESASWWLRVVPWGFTKLLGWIKTSYDNPEVYIFENGFSDRDGLQDNGRIEYYNLYLNAMLDAIEQGANVVGYTAWSLMDNFEWLAGYTERFGLYHVDFKSPQRTRTPKASAAYYNEIVTTRVIESELKQADFNYYRVKLMNEKVY